MVFFFSRWNNIVVNAQSYCRATVAQQLAVQLHASHSLENGKKCPQFSDRPFFHSGILLSIFTWGVRWIAVCLAWMPSTLKLAKHERHEASADFFFWGGGVFLCGRTQLSAVKVLHLSVSSDRCVPRNRSTPLCHVITAAQAFPPPSSRFVHPRDLGLCLILDVLYSKF